MLKEAHTLQGERRSTRVEDTCTHERWLTRSHKTQGNVTEAMIVHDKNK